MKYTGFIFLSIKLFIYPSINHFNQSNCFNQTVIIVLDTLKHLVNSSISLFELNDELPLLELRFGWQFYWFLYFVDLQTCLTYPSFHNQTHQKILHYTIIQIHHYIYY